MRTPVLFITAITLCVLFTLLVSSCAKDYSFEGGSRPDSTSVTIPPGSVVASYQLAGFPGSCSLPQKGGTYQPFLPCNNSNYAALLVDVMSTGSYSITTDTVDGICFSAKGVFTKTGSQRVALVANGTPQFPRNLVFTAASPASSCAFSLVVVTPGVPATYVLESRYDSTCASHAVNGVYSKDSALTYANTITIKTFVAAKGVYTIATNTVNGISFSFTGVFTSTGTVFTDLVGTGTPMAKGSFTYQLQIVGPSPIGGETCDFKVTVN